MDSSDTSPGKSFLNTKDRYLLFFDSGVTVVGIRTRKNLRLGSRGQVESVLTSGWVIELTLEVPSGTRS